MNKPKELHCWQARKPVSDCDNTLEQKLKQSIQLLRTRKEQHDKVEIPKVSHRKRRVTGR